MALHLWYRCYLLNIFNVGINILFVLGSLISFNIIFYTAIFVVYFNLKKNKVKMHLIL